MTMEIVSINVRGLNSQSKRQTLFHWLESKQYDIICLQETFCTDEKKSLYNSDWNGSIIHCTSNSPHSRGVSVLFRKKFEFEILSQYHDNEGRLLLLNINHNGQTWTMVNVYAPTEVKHRKILFMKWKTMDY